MRIRLVALCVLSLYAFAWAAVPLIAAIRWSGSEGSRPMTTGCAEATCCTSRCFLDEHGVHHCVPKEGTSCGCGLSSSDQNLGLPICIDEGLPPAPGKIPADLAASECSCNFPSATTDVYQLIPVPPPRS